MQFHYRLGQYPGLATVLPAYLEYALVPLTVGLKMQAFLAAMLDDSSNVIILHSSIGPI